MVLLLIFSLIHQGLAEDFWDEIEDDDNEVKVEENVEGKLYDKARFNLPISRRLRLYPEIKRCVEGLKGKSSIEFIYESKHPILTFLDSHDVVVETYDLSKKTSDEVLALLNLRGFALISEEAKEIPPAPQTKINETTQENSTNDSKESL